jgi:hypothetical protein
MQAISFKRHRFPPEFIHQAVWLYARFRHCQRKIDYFARTSDSYFAAIDFSRFFLINLSGSTATSNIQNFALTLPFRARSVQQ